MGKTRQRRDEIFVVSVVPCLAKKFEAARPEFAPDGIRDVDAVLTTTELLEMATLSRIDPKEIALSEFDEPYKQVSGAGVLFGASGGVAEAALRMAVEKVTGESIDGHLDFEEVRGAQGFKETNVKMGDKNVRLAVISGLKNAIPLMEKIEAGVDVGYDLIEVMACPSGCIAGAGHPVPNDVLEMEARRQVLLNIDRTSKYRKSHTNPDILRLYDEFYKEPNSELAHHLLHTHFEAKLGDGRVMKNRDIHHSAVRTRDVQICQCEACTKIGSRQLIDDTQAKVRMLRLDTVLDVKPIRLSNHIRRVDLHHDRRA